MNNKDLTINDYQDAITVQSASNLSGVVKSFARVIEKISKEGFNEYKGTDWVNAHPICRLYAEQICHLTGGGTPSNGDSYHSAYKHIEQRIEKYEKTKYDLLDNPKEAIEVLCHTSTRNADTIMYTIEDIRYPHFNGKKIRRRLINGEYTYKWIKSKINELEKEQSNNESIKH